MCMRVWEKDEYFRSFCNVRYRMVAVVATITTTKRDDDEKIREKEKRVVMYTHQMNKYLNDSWTNNRSKFR